MERPGGTWTSVAHNPIILNGVACITTDFCLGVGSGGSAQVAETDVSVTTTIERLAGASWQRVRSPNSSSSENTLNSVACTTAEACVAVGTYTGPPLDEPLSKRQGGTLIEVESNGIWHLSPVPKSPANVNNMLASVSCPSSHACIGVGQSVVNALRVPSGPIKSFSVLIVD